MTRKTNNIRDEGCNADDSKPVLSNSQERFAWYLQKIVWFLGDKSLVWDPHNNIQEQHEDIEFHKIHHASIFYKAGEGVYFDDVLLVRFLQDLDFSNTTTIDAIIFAINSLTDDSLVGNVFVSCLIFL